MEVIPFILIAEWHQSNAPLVPKEIKNVVKNSIIKYAHTRY